MAGRIGTVVSEPQRFDLVKSLPATDTEEVGYIVARPLPYGMKLERRDKSTIMKLQQKIGKKKSRNQDDEVQMIELESISTWAAQFDFGFCIVEHNICDVNGQMLDFSNAMVLKILDPKIGSEIEEILAELNGDEPEESDLEDFTRLHTSPLPDATQAVTLTD